MLGEERDHLVDAELGLAEHLRLEIEQELAVEQVDLLEALERAFERDRLQRPRQLRFAREREEHVGVAERRAGRAAREDLVAEDGRVLRADDRLEERRHALAADDVAQLARELLLALLLGVAHRVRGGLHAGVDLALEADLRAVVDARGADEEADLSGVQIREALARRVDQLLPQLLRDAFDAFSR
jgi:hypothetical protein